MPRPDSQYLRGRLPTTKWLGLGGAYAHPGPWRPVRLLLRGETYLKDYPVINFNPKAKQPIEVWLPEGTIVGRGESTALSSEGRYGENCL